jgi:hypothetical protein
MTKPATPPFVVSLLGEIRKLVAQIVPLSQYVVTIGWWNEELAEDMARYMDAYKEEPDMVASFEEWNMSYGSRE